MNVRWLTASQQRTWRAFLGSTTVLFDQLDRELQQQSGIPMTYYEILVRLSESPGRALRMGELAECSQSSRSRLSHAVARLEESGWIRREAFAGDRRGALAVLTDAGHAALVAAAPGHVESVRSHLFDQLTEEEQDQLGTIFAKISGHLADLDRHPTRPRPPRPRPGGADGADGADGCAAPETHPETDPATDRATDPEAGPVAAERRSGEPG